MSELIPSQNLKDLDPVVADIIRREAERQRRKIILIASESICPPAVREALSCEFGNIYAEGYPSPRTYFEPARKLSSFQHQLSHFRRLSNRRYYKGCEYVDILESTCRRRAAEAFSCERVKPEEIFVNVQPLSGAAANNAVYNAFVKPGDTVMGAALSHGGHLTHGASVNRSGANHKVVAYQLSHTGKLDYDEIEALALEAKPKLLISGFSAYPWDVDWARLRVIADKVKAILLADIAHLAGMVAAGLLNNPLGHAHVVSFTTHKTLCGPRGAMLMCTDPWVAGKLDFGVFPGEQGGPHIHALAAKAVAMKLARTEEFRALQRGVLENSKALAAGFEAEGLQLAYGGTNTHLCLLDLRSFQTPNGLPLTGEIASRLLDLAGITCNKNTIAGDANAIHPSGLRFGTTWATQRGFRPEHMRRLAGIVARLLRSVHPFSYIGGRVEWGRGKLPQASLEEAAREVDRLIEDADHTYSAAERVSAFPHFVGPERGARATALESLHKSQGVKLVERDGWRVPERFGDPAAEAEAVRGGAALVDAGGALLLEVGSGHAAALLEGACSAEVAQLLPGRVAAGLVLDGAAKPLGRALVVRLPDDEDGYDRFWVKISTPEPERCLRWLRGLSDGYLMQDEDVWLKTEGPAVVEDLADRSDGGERLACLGLRGPRAAEALAKAFGCQAPAPGQAIQQDGLWLVSRPAPASPGFEVFVPVGRAAATWSRLLEAGAKPVGCASMVQALPGPALESTTDLGAAPWRDWLRLSKPFFVGQKAVRRSGAQAEARPAFEWKAPELAEPRKTCLYPEHEKLCSAKHLVPFAGYKMPVMYESILAEHETVRKRCGLFDVTHMGVLDVRGPFAERFLDLVTTNYVPNLAEHQGHYSYLLAPDGRCIDDIIIGRLGGDHFMVVVNASNAEEDEAWLRAVLAGRVRLDDQRPDVHAMGECVIRNLRDVAQAGEDARVDLALQGPKALDILRALVDGPAGKLALERLRKFFLARVRLAGMDVIATRTGYTGSEGYELYVHPERAPRLWAELLTAGQPHGLAPCGLGARDSLRTEAGFPLHGHELAGPHAIQPVEAGYGAFVKLHKPFFAGRTAALGWHQNRDRVIVRYEVDEKGGKVLRPGNPVLDAKKGEYAGYVTSAASTPERQVGLALVSAKFAKRANKLQIVPLTDHDKTPPARSPLELKPGDWVAVPRQATIRVRFMRPNEKPLKGKDAQ
ncbi:MAG TPA: glycine cleavage system aminomethyltransferase GcvT [Myxococcota bacterium]|nr:glycine cleavage system aminomethyltransferase GcvT [Myxococcota bacterium]HRY94940.1 glycine cleavage system aminomethyltransferase GcvT [Myxococcota bacterium]